MIERLRVHNYRSLRDCTVDMSRFTCIIGQNNAGKSSVLNAIDLFCSNNKIPAADFYDESKPIRIEATLQGISNEALQRITPDHRRKIEPLIKDGKLTLARHYAMPGATPELLCLTTRPSDCRFHDLEDKLKGLRGISIGRALAEVLPEYPEYFSGVDTQGLAKAAIEELISGMPEGQLEEVYAPLPTGIPNSIKALLPEVIFIPAVKDISDEVKMKESATFGRLIGAVMERLQDTVHMGEIASSLENLNLLLNRAPADDGSETDERIPALREAESAVRTYLREQFPSIDLELAIPPLELKQIFSSARILVNDGVKGEVSTKGDGLRRSVVFALIRAYADLKQKPSSTEGSDASGESSAIQQSNYIFLFEEPELFLHPSAQRILLDALLKIAPEHQVVLSTHSPMFFVPRSTGAFIKMTKISSCDGIPYSKPISVDLEKPLHPKDEFQLLCHENNAAALFADRVVLVEGDSELCFIRHIAQTMRPEWDFDAKNIPLIKMNGKAGLKRYRDFFRRFAVDVHVILDLDVLLDEFGKIEAAREVGELRSRLLQEADRIAKSEGIDGIRTSNDAKSLVQSQSFRERFREVIQIIERCMMGESITPGERDKLDDLLWLSRASARYQVLSRSEAGVSGKAELLHSLRVGNVYVLSRGCLEDYYPDGVNGADKVSRAISACKLITCPEAIGRLCPQVTEDGQSMPEFEAIFRRIFS